MAFRSSWKGYLRLSLVSVPVQAVNAAAGASDLHFNQLHEKCNSRIKYQKVCPIHGVVTNDEIVSGYEYADGQYVVIEPDELDKLRRESDKAINIDTFIDPDSIDPVYFDGRDYYLLPDGAGGQKPYAVLHGAMTKEKKAAVGQAVLWGKEQLVLVRPLEDLLVMSMLNYAQKVRKPQSFTDELAKPSVSKEELRLAEALIKASTAKRFNLERYEDLYARHLAELIESKVEGKEIVAPPAEEDTPVINLMDALRQSVSKAKKSAPAKSPAKAPAGRQTKSKSARKRA